MPLSQSELARYARQLNLPDFGPAAQEKLKASKVLVIGAGGLGSPLLQYLAAAGIGKIGIVDGDQVAKHNLQRQVLFDEASIGLLKVDVGAQRLRAMNSSITVETFPTFLTKENALDILAEYDVIADASDNLPTRYLVNDACVLLNKVLIYGAVYQFEGQVSVFHYMKGDGSHGPNYRDLYPSPPPPEWVPDCTTGGVLGVLPAIIGSMQALEVIKVITGIGDPLAGRLFVFDAAAFGSHTLKFGKHPENPLTGEHPAQTGLIDYAAFCGISQVETMTGQSMNVQTLHQQVQQGQTPYLIDVREPYEYEIVNLGGQLMPLGQLPQLATQIPRDQAVVVHCKSGQRSQQAIELLSNTYGFKNLIQLEGGIMAYREFIDPQLPAY